MWPDILGRYCWCELYILASMPPSTVSVCPLINPGADDARNKTTGAMSSVLAPRPH